MTVHDPAPTSAVTPRPPQPEVGSFAPPTPTTGRLPLIGQTMIERGFITAKELGDALEDQQRTGRRVGEILVDMGVLSAVDLTALLAERRGLAFIDLDANPPTIDPSSLITEEIARRYGVLPVAREADRVVLAMANPDDVFAIDDLTLAIGTPISGMMAEPNQVRQAIDRWYAQTKLTRRTDDAHDDLDEEMPDTALQGEDGPIVGLVNALLDQALAEGASDIHIEPLKDVVRVRFRTDGVLHRTSELRRGLLRPMVSRLKVLAGIDITQTRLPTDGRFSVALNGRSPDVRVATIPTSFGEAVVLRLLDRDRGPLDAATLGMAGDARDRFDEAVSLPQGGIIVSGPTGSGKTSTLYATLLRLNSEERSIISIEDPVEYQLEGIKQIQVNPRIGLTFASALRAILRADPDVVMVGEIRDTETTRLACEAAITGHLVLSTVHSNKAAGTPLRLIDMGVEPYVVASALTCVVAQRLARSLCTACAEPHSLPDDFLQRLGCPEDLVQTAVVRRAVGCPRCQNTGYSGRTALYEVMTIDEPIARLIIDRASSREIERQAIIGGMKPLHVAAVDRLIAGELSIEEMLRVVAR